jgi:hypothetical protein
MCSEREEGNVDNAARNDGGDNSMVHRCGLKNLLTVKVRALEILKLRTTRNKRAKDRPTTFKKILATVRLTSIYYRVPGN